MCSRQRHGNYGTVHPRFCPFWRDPSQTWASPPPEARPEGLDPPLADPGALPAACRAVPTGCPPPGPQGHLGHHPRRACQGCGPSWVLARVWRGMGFVRWRWRQWLGPPLGCQDLLKPLLPLGWDNTVDFLPELIRPHHCQTP